MQVSELRTFLDNLEPDDELLMFGSEMLTASRAGQVIDCLKLPRLALSSDADIDAATKKFWNEARGK